MECRFRAAILFVINHEAPSPETVIRLADLGFEVGQLVDLADGRPVAMESKEGLVQLKLSVPLGETRLLHILRK